MVQFLQVGQPVAISRDNPQEFILYLPQHAVEIIPHILLGHGKSSAINQALKLTLLYRKLMRSHTVFNIRELTGWQGSKRETAASGFYGDFAVLRCKLDIAALRQ